MIIIAGDSWGQGEWNLIDGVHRITHPGLSQYLIEDGKKVLNVSVAGSCLQSVIHQLNLVDKLISMPLSSTTIIVFQTEWHRHLLPILHPDSLFSFVFNHRFIDYHISHWLNQLSRLAISRKVRIGLVGGASDTIWLDRFELEYPGLYIACQSLTNLCINDTDRIDDPVMSLEFPLIETFKSRCVSEEDLRFLIETLDKESRRIELFKQHPFWFPDVCHGSRAAHRKLYEFLCDQNYL